MTAEQIAVSNYSVKITNCTGKEPYYYGPNETINFTVSKKGFNGDVALQKLFYDNSSNELDVNLTVYNLEPDVKFWIEGVRVKTNSKGNFTFTGTFSGNSSTINVVTDPYVKNFHPRNSEKVLTDTMFSVDVRDAMFTNSSEQVTVNFYLDGNMIHSETVSSNKEVSYGFFTYTVNSLDYGDHVWSVTAVDKEGNSYNSGSIPFQVVETGGNVSIWNSTQLSETNISNITSGLMEGHGNASLTNVSYYLSSIQDYVIGGSRGGQVVTALIVLGVTVAAVSTAGVSVAGAVALGSTAIGILSFNGNLPAWIWPVCLTIIGLMVAVIFIKIQR